MQILDILFYVFAVLIIGSAIIVVTSKNIMYSAFSLLFTFFGVAGLYVLLNADFIAISQIMIYIGGILVLIIFGVMLTSKITDVDIKTGTSGRLQVMFTSIIVLALTVILIVTYLNSNWFKKPSINSENTIKPIGNILLTDYLMAFEVASVLLLIAIIGAALIARRK
jgi:NADH-quinone oxidoreductase subunit J